MSTAGEQPAATDVDPADARKLQDSLLRMQQTFKELVDYARYYAELHWDQIKLSVVKYALMAVLGIVMAIFGATLLVTGGIVLVIGLSYSLAEWLFDGNGAYGLLLCGSIIVGLLLATVAIGIAIVRGRFQAHLGQKYANKKREQRARYGHDVEQRAAVA
jgi:hypothetical protein